TIEKPGIRNSVGRERMTSLHLANVSQGFGLFRAGGIPTGVSAGGVDHGSTLVLLLDEFCDVRGDLDVVVGVADNRENVDFVSAVGRGIRIIRVLLGRGRGD